MADTGFDWASFWPAIKAVGVFCIGYVIAKVVAKTSVKITEKHATPQQSMILKKILFFTILAMFLVSALQQIGFQLSVLLGSAGILTAGVAFASKTAMSNVISGIFLILEKSFVVGDIIKVKGITGKVKSIDLISVKISTLEHTLVRIPNESILSSELVNLSHFHYRRLDILIGVAYGTDIEKAKQSLLDIANDNELSLSSPEPNVRITDFGDSAINMRLSVYVVPESFGKLKLELHEALLKSFDKNKIDIPFPQLTVHMEKSD